MLNSIIYALEAIFNQNDQNEGVQVASSINQHDNNYESNYVSVAVNDLRIGDIVPYLGREATITDIRTSPIRSGDGVLHEDHLMKTCVLNNDPKSFVAFTNPETSTHYKLNALKVAF